MNFTLRGLRFLFLLCWTAQAQDRTTNRDFTQYVDPFIGTAPGRATYFPEPPTRSDWYS